MHIDQKLHLTHQNETNIGFTMKLFGFLPYASVCAAGKKLARSCSGRRRGGPDAASGRPDPASSRRDHPRRRHDFDQREVERVCPEAALHPTFSVEEATGHDPAVLEPDVVQRLRHCLGDVVVPAGPNFRRHTKVIKVSLPNLKPPLEHAAPAL